MLCKRTLGILFASFTLVETAIAGPLEDGLTSIDQRDYATAVGLLQPLAENGNAEAQINLANMYFDGNGVRQDYAQAVSWYPRAADQGNTDAQIALGFLYKYGEGVRFDYVQSYKWFDLAGSTPDRDIVATMMTPAQIADAQRLAREWRTK